MTDHHNHTPAGGPANSDMANSDMANSDMANGDMANDQWVPCAEGELRRMVARDRSARLNRTLTKGVAAGAVCIALLGGWVVTSQRGRDATSGKNLAGITCTAVHAQLDQYVDGTLDDATSQQIRDHLRLCPKCGPVYEQMTGQPVAFNQHFCADPTCRRCGSLQPQQVLLAGGPGPTTVTLAMK